jgi:hypothetical protein
MAISPWPQGATFPPGQFTLTMDNGKPLPLNFSPAPTVQLLIRNLATQVEIAGSSMLTIVDPVNSIVSCAWSTQDVGLPVGEYEVRAKVTYNGGGASGVTYSDPQSWNLVIS